MDGHVRMHMHIYAYHTNNIYLPLYCHIHIALPLAPVDDEFAVHRLLLWYFDWTITIVRWPTFRQSNKSHWKFHYIYITYSRKMLVFVLLLLHTIDTPVGILVPPAAPMIKRTSVPFLSVIIMGDIDDWARFFGAI